MEVNEEGLLVLSATGWEKLDYGTAEEESKYAITGDESQVMTMKLDQGETLHTEPGVFMYRSGGITADTGYEGCFARCCAGESCCSVKYTNTGGSNNEVIAITPNFPSAKLIPVDLSDPNIGGTLLSQGGAYVAHLGDVEVGMDLDCNPSRACCGGTGFIRQELTGTGTAFIEGLGTVVQKLLADDEKIVVDTNCILAWAKTVDVSIRRAGTIVGMFGGGEGIFNTVLTGPGLIIVQSFTVDQLHDIIAMRRGKNKGPQVI